MENHFGTLYKTSYKVKHIHAIDPPNPVPKYLSKRNENVTTKRLVCEYSNTFIYNSLKLETVQMFIIRKLNKQIVMCSHDGILLSNTKGTNQ